MPKVFLDISIHSEDHAVGMASGEFAVTSIPQVGDALNLGCPPTCQAIVEDRNIPYTGLLRSVAVADFESPDGEIERLVMLETLVGKTVTDAQKLLDYFHAKHGLFPDIWDNEIERP